MMILSDQDGSHRSLVTLMARGALKTGHMRSTSLETKVSCFIQAFSLTFLISPLIIGLVAKTSHSDHGITARLNKKSINKPFVLQVCSSTFLLTFSENSISLYVFSMK